MPAHRRVSLAQERLLVQLMQENPDIANGRGSGQAPPLAKQAVAIFWESVASQLNAMGTGATKVGPKWRDYWTERKYGVRKKAAALMEHATGTGGGPAKPGSLSDVEEAILQIMGTVTVFAEPEVQISFGEPSTSETLPLTSPVTPTPPTAPRPPPTAPPPSSPPLQQHSENQLTTHAPAWAIDIENRRLETENRQLEVQQQLASAVERLATVAEKQTSAFEWLASVAEMQNSAVTRLATAAEVQSSALERLATAAEASSELLRLLLKKTRQRYKVENFFWRMQQALFQLKGIDLEKAYRRHNRG